MNLEIPLDFLSIAETMSLTQSAEARGTTRSNLSKRIRQLKTWLGRDLVDRRGRPLALTKAGRDFAAVACGIVADLDASRGRTLQGVSSKALRASRCRTVPPSPSSQRSKRRCCNVFQAAFAPRLTNHDMGGVMPARSGCDPTLATFHPKVL